MKESKYVGKTFGNWIVANIYLAGNYEHGTRHPRFKPAELDYLLGKADTLNV